MLKKKKTNRFLLIVCILLGCVALLIIFDIVYTKAIMDNGQKRFIEHAPNTLGLDLNDSTIYFEVRGYSCRIFKERYKKYALCAPQENQGLPEIILNSKLNNEVFSLVYYLDSSEGTVDHQYSEENLIDIASYGMDEKMSTEFSAWARNQMLIKERDVITINDTSCEISFALDYVTIRIGFMLP